METDELGEVIGVINLIFAGVSYLIKILNSSFNKFCHNIKICGEQTLI